jgi:predicted DNA binding protein
MKNYKLAREALANDCHLVGEYVGPPGSAHTCPIGRLAIMSGVTRNELRKVNGISIWTILPDQTIVNIQHKIHEKFGLSIKEMARLQEANDSYLDKLDSSLTERQKDVLKVLDNIHQQSTS